MREIKRALELHRLAKHLDRLRFEALVKARDLEQQAAGVARGEAGSGPKARARGV